MNKIDSKTEKEDWGNFHFPPRPPKRWDGYHDKNDIKTTSKEPNWTAPPREVRHWHLDMENLLIVHPVNKKKIDLTKINTKLRLIKLLKLMRNQPSDDDISSLWIALDNAFIIAWEKSLPEILAFFKDRWEWPEFENHKGQNDNIDLYD